MSKKLTNEKFIVSICTIFTCVVDMQTTYNLDSMTTTLRIIIYICMYLLLPRQLSLEIRSKALSALVVLQRRRFVEIRNMALSALLVLQPWTALEIGRMAPSLSFLRNTKSCSIVQETKGSRSFASFTCRRTSMSVTRTDVAHVPNWQRAAEATNLLTLQICSSLSGRKLRAQLFSSSKPTTRHWRCSTSGPLQRMTSPGFFSVGRKRIHRSALCWKPWGGCYSRPWCECWTRAVLTAWCQFWLSRCESCHTNIAYWDCTPCSMTVAGPSSSYGTISFPADLFYRMNSHLVQGDQLSDPTFFWCSAALLHVQCQTDATSGMLWRVVGTELQVKPAILTVISVFVCRNPAASFAPHEAGKCVVAACVISQTCFGNISCIYIYIRINIYIYTWYRVLYIYSIHIKKALIIPIPMYIYN